MIYLEDLTLSKYRVKIVKNFINFYSKFLKYGHFFIDEINYIKPNSDILLDIVDENIF